MVSQNQLGIKYGIVEVRAILPSGTGTWPAIWMLPTNWEYGGWPTSGEIDIMEHVGYQENFIHGTVHTKSYNHTLNTQKGSSLHIDEVTSQFHVYKIQWLPNKIEFYIDDSLYYTFDNQDVECPTENEWPFDKEFNIILNLAIGGNWGGAQGVDNSFFPQSMMVDYVRVFQSVEIKSKTS